MKLWFRTIFFKLVKLFSFFLFTSFLLFILVDISINGVQFFSKGTSFLEIGLYYLLDFSLHLELLVPFAFLLATLKVLFDLTDHRELVALQMAGLSKKKLLTPLFLFAGILAIGCYLNSQWLIPKATLGALSFKESHARHQKKVRDHLFAITLKDGSELIYQSYDKKTKELFDVFWIQSSNDIWHMKYLQSNTARFADHLQRNDKNQMVKTESFDTKEFPWDETPSFEGPFTDKHTQSAYFHYHLALPLLPFLILFAISPIAMRYSRTKPTFFIVACSLFALLGLKTLLDSMLILAENQVFTAPMAMWIPLSICFLLTIPSFVKN